MKKNIDERYSKNVVVVGLSGRYKIFPIVMFILAWAFWFSTIFWSFNKEYTFFKVIYVLLLFVLTGFIIYSFMLPRNVIVLRIEKKEVVIYGGMSYFHSFKKIVLSYNDILNVDLDLEENYPYIKINTTKGVVKVKRVIQKEKTIAKINTLVLHEEENLIDMKKVLSTDINDVYNLEGVNFISLIDIYLTSRVFFFDASDEVLDVYVYIQFVRNLIAGNLFDFINEHLFYIDRLLKFMDKLDLGWSKVNFEDYLSILPSYKNEDYFKNVKIILTNESDSQRLVEELTKINEKLVSAHIDNDSLLYRKLEKYLKAHPIDFHVEVDAEFEKSLSTFKKKVVDE